VRRQEAADLTSASERGLDVDFRRAGVGAVTTAVKALAGVLRLAVLCAAFQPGAAIH
jgi:hypothetical protein